MERTYYISLENDKSWIEYICVDKTDLDDNLVADITKLYVLE